MTKAERKWRAEREKERRAMGLCPSDNEKINLSKLETYEEWERTNSTYFVWDFHSMNLKGISTPNKKRLNRRKYINEARNQWCERDVSYLWEFYLTWAMLWMTSHIDSNSNPSLEAVGAAKVVKIALKLKEFKEKREAGKLDYTAEELYEYLKEIMEA